MEQNDQGIQQSCTSLNESELSKPMSDCKKRKMDEENSTNMDEQLLQGVAKHNFKSKIERKVKFFHPDTREWLLKQIYSWFELEDDSRILLITAGPGFGKSVFAAKVCEIFEEKGKLAACHFCDFSNSNLKDPLKMLQSLASHMCQNIAGFREKLLDQLKRPHNICSLKDAFQIYLQNPLDDLEVERSLIVIDGLDESTTDDKSDMVKLIADNFSDLPECVKVLVTSRPELTVQGLDHVEKIEVGVDDVDNRLDILKYLRFCLPNLAVRDSKNRSTRHDSRSEVLPKVVEKCEGSFLFAFHVQQELNKRKDLDTVKFQEIISFLPKGMGSVYHDYFHRLEKELAAVMKRNPDLFKILELLVGIDTTKGKLPLKFIARALDLPLDCRETRKIINKVNDAVSCLLYVSDDFITGFHKSVYDWLVADGYDEHEYTVKVSDGKKRLWQVCEQVLKEIKDVVSSGKDLKLTNEVKHSLEHGYEYLLACDMKDGFSWLVDMIIVHVFLTVYPKSTYNLHWMLIQASRQTDRILSIQLRQRISWHVTELGYLLNNRFSTNSEFDHAKSFSYLENVLENYRQGCFTDDERNIAELILTKSSRCVKRISVGMNSLSPLFTIILQSTIVAVGVSSNKRLAAAALRNGTICVLSLPELVKLWQYSTEYNSISCCTFAPDDTYILYGKLEKVINIEQRKEVTLFDGEVGKFKSCSFSPNGKRLLTNDGSDTLKLWDVVRRRLVAVLSAGTPVDCCTFTSTGLFIVGGTASAKEDTYSVWNSITLTRVDQRIYFSASKRINEDVVFRSKRCNRCFRQEYKELIPCIHVNTDEKHCKISTGFFKEDCIFSLVKQESLHIIKTIHFKILAAWEIFVKNREVVGKDVPFFDILAIEDDHWLYSDGQTLVVFSSFFSSQSRPTCVLWCSFSPDGAGLATCTSDGFINLWNVETSQAYQRFRSSRDTFSAACWWSDKYLFVCHVTDTIPSLSRYPVGESLKILVNGMQSMPLCPVNDAFLLFSGFLDFSEGYLSFTCWETEPVKVLDIREVGNPKKIMLPEIQPVVSIAVSANASFVLATTGDEYFLWKKSETQPDLYSLFVKRKLTFNVLPKFIYMYSTPFTFECCFSNDGKFALVSSSMWNRRGLFVIDLDSGSATWREIFDKTNRYLCRYVEAKIFCSDTVVLSLTPNLIEILCLKTWKRLDLSFQRYLTKNSLLNSKLSPKGTVLAVPRLSGDMEFLQLCVPK